MLTLLGVGVTTRVAVGVGIRVAVGVGIRVAVGAANWGRVEVGAGTLVFVAPGTAVAADWELLPQAKPTASSRAAIPAAAIDNLDFLFLGSIPVPSGLLENTGPLLADFLSIIWLITLFGIMGGIIGSPGYGWVVAPG